MSSAMKYGLFWLIPLLNSSMLSFIPLDPDMVTAAFGFDKNMMVCLRRVQKECCRRVGKLGLKEFLAILLSSPTTRLL
jgi:hypothetical protein